MQVEDNRLTSLKAYFMRSMRQTIYEETEWPSLFRLLCTDILQLSSSQIMLDEETRLSESEILKGLQAIKRLKKGEPIQYIIGHTEFYGLQLKTDGRALIPRPETEELVQWILNEEKKVGCILDIGTGTGCIALALKHHLPHAEIQAIDFSEHALELARENARALDLAISFIQDDILDPQHDHGDYDVIISNPPYVMDSEKAEMRNNVLDYEPHSALFVPDQDALKFYRAILSFAQDHLREAGHIYFEINEVKAQVISELSEEMGFASVEIRQDLYGKDRMMRIGRAKA